MSFLTARKSLPNLRHWSRYRLTSSSTLGHDGFLENFKLPINFTSVQVGDFIDQNLNQGLRQNARLFSFKSRIKVENLNFEVFKRSFTVPTQSCFIFRTRKQRNEIGKGNKIEWVETRLRNSFTVFF